MLTRFQQGLGAVALAASTLWAGEAALAADPFTVTNVIIDERADNATEAQRRALQAGQIRAARRLVERMTLPEDRAGSVGAGQVQLADPQTGLQQPASAGLPELTSEMAARLVAGYDIANERRSTTRYIAEMSVGFDRRAVRTFFESYNVPFVQAQARPILVVPVLDTGIGAVWEGPWYDAWRRETHEHALTPFIGLGSRFEDPSGPGFVGNYLETDLEADTEAVAHARSANEPVLRELASLYGVDRVAVLTANASAGSVRTGGILFDFSGDETATTQVEDLSVAGDYTALAGALVDRFETAWKRQTVVRGGDESSVQVTLLYDNILDWQALQTAVAGASLVSNARLDALSTRGAVMTLAYRGGLDQVASELRSRGARLDETEDMGWTVRRSR
jgi:hypothetical protein